MHTLFTQFVRTIISILCICPATMAHYQYEPLSKENQEIRLLRFNHSPTPQAASADTIEISLKTVSLQDQPQYTALSYVWGDPTQVVPISINGHTFNVTKNLHAALQKLQDDDAIEHLWVDAICINQNDDREKSWQVQQMASLYEKTGTVLIWLGDSANNSDEAMDELESIGSIALKARVLQLFDESVESLRRRRTLSGLLEQNAPKQRVLDKDSAENVVVQLDRSTAFRSPSMQAAIRSLLDRVLWRRAWIVQEISLSKQAYIVCGDKRLTIDCFDAALATIILCQEALYAVRTDLNDCFPLLKPALLNLRSLNHRRKRKIDQKPRLSSLLLHQHRRGPKHAFLAAFDPRDVIFALLAVAGDTVPRPPLGSILGIEADYTKSTEAVFTETTRAFLGLCPWYRLEYCTFPKNRTDLPSWVPDWKKVAAEGVSCNPISIWKLFSASADKIQGPPPSSFNSSETTVLLRSGCRVDVITAVMDAPEWVLSEAEQDYRVKDRHAWLETVGDFGGLRSPSHFQGEVWRTLVADIQRDRRTGKSFRTDGKWMELTRKIFRDQEDVMMDRDEEIPGLGERRHFLGQTWWSSPGINSTAERIQLAAHRDTLLSWAEWIGYGRTLFKTSEGRLGLGPAHMRADDIVTIIFGTQVPIILRPLDMTHFEYLGEAYVHGIMDGDFMATNPPQEVFKLF